MSQLGDGLVFNFERKSKRYLPKWTQIEKCSNNLKEFVGKRSESDPTIKLKLQNSIYHTNSNSCLTTKTPINSPSKSVSQIACSVRRTNARSRQEEFNQENQTTLPKDLSLEYGGAYLGSGFGILGWERLLLERIVTYSPQDKILTSTWPEFDRRDSRTVYDELLSNSVICGCSLQTPQKCTCQCTSMFCVQGNVYKVKGIE